MLVKSLAIVAATTLPLVSGMAMKRDGSAPGYPTDPNATKKCTYWIDNDDAGVAACKEALDFWQVSAQDFHSWNPSVDTSCNNYKAHMSYCVEAPSTGGTTTTTSSIKTTSTTTTTTTTKPGNGVTTPTPTQPGMVDNCSAFSKVEKGDTCDTIASRNGITRKDVQTWNTQLGADCSGLWADVYVCVNVIGRDPNPTTTKPGNGIATPTPTQPGMVDNCNKFYKVQKDENCDTVAGKNGISRKALQLWNTQLKDDCSGLWADVYVCVGVINGQDPGTPADPPNSVQTPSPVQQGITNVCKKFHKVQDGQGCDVVANMYGISTEDYISWNSKPGGGCGSIWGQTYSCVGIINKYNFDEGNNQRWTTVDGTFKPQNGALVGSNRGKAVLTAGLNDFVFSVDVTVARGGANAGVLFRASDVGNGADAYKGYYFGISADGYGVLGRASNNWNELRRFNMDVRTGQKYRVRIVGLADQIYVYVDDMYNAKAFVRDGTFRSGYAGLRVYDTDATYDNAEIQPIVYDGFERNLVNWHIGDGGFDARTGEMVSSETDSGKISLNTKFDDFSFEGDLLLQKSGGGNVGFIVRANDLGNGADSYRGYYIGIETSGKLTLGLANYNWRELTSRNVGFSDNRWYHIKINAVGDLLEIFVDDMFNPKITYRDGTFRSGMVGVRVFRSAAKADNIRVTPAIN